QVFDQLKIPSKRIFSLVLLGRVALAVKDFISAESCAKEIESISSTMNLPFVLFPYYLLSAEINEGTHKFEEARRHYEAAANELERAHARLHHNELRATFF